MSHEPLGPESRDAEQHVLGSMLYSERAISDVVEIISGRDFNDGRHQRIYDAIVEVYNAGTTVSVATVAEHLRRAGNLEHAGGVELLRELAAQVTATGNVSHHAKLIRELAVARDLAHAGAEIQRLGNDRPGDIENLLDRAEQTIYEISRRTSGPDLVKIYEPLKQAWDDLVTMHESGQDVIGVPTGLKALDRITSGLRPGTLVIVAARPGMGKSALALGIAAHAAHHEQIPTGIFSLEMSGVEIAQRLLARFARVNLHSLARGKFHSDELTRIARASDLLAKAPLYVDDSASPTLAEMRSRARRLRTREPRLGLLVVDYLQLLARGKFEHVVQEVTAISRDLKLLARDLNVPVIAVSQLSREVERRTPPRPQLSDLRQSGSIEQDADLVVFVYREHYYKPDSADPALAELIIGKHRNGPRDTADVAWKAEYATFTDLSPEPASA